MMTLIQNIDSPHLLCFSASSYWKLVCPSRITLLSSGCITWVLILPIEISYLGMLSLGLSSAVASQSLLPSVSIPDASFWRLP